MRVTNQMLNRNVLQNIQKNLNRMQKYQHQLSTGRVLNKPSDNPLSAVRVMSLNSRLNTGEQYKKNIDSGLSWLGVTETALSGVNDVMQRARELTVYGANGALSDDARYAIAQEVDQLLGNLVQISNSALEDRYVFGGYSTSVPPFTLDESTDIVTYGGDEGRIRWEVAQGVSMEMNVNGQDLFLQGGNLFNTLRDLKGFLLNDITEVIPDYSFEVGAGEWAVNLNDGGVNPSTAEITQGININGPELTPGAASFTLELNIDDTTEPNTYTYSVTVFDELDGNGEILSRDEYIVDHAGPFTYNRYGISFELDPGDASQLELVHDFEKEPVNMEEQEANIGNMLERMDVSINKVLNLRAVVGARMNRLEMAEERNFDEKLNMNIMRTELYDIDLAELIMNYSLQESIYQASLSTGARTIQMSLVDFIR